MGPANIASRNETLFVTLCINNPDRSAFNVQN
jgi:hypothetical protein